MNKYLMSVIRAGLAHPGWEVSPPSVILKIQELSQSSYEEAVNSLSFVPSELVKQAFDSFIDLPSSESKAKAYLQDNLLALQGLAPIINDVDEFSFLKLATGLDFSKHAPTAETTECVRQYVALNMQNAPLEDRQTALDAVYASMGNKATLAFWGGIVPDAIKGGTAKSKQAALDLFEAFLVDPDALDQFLMDDHTAKQERLNADIAKRKIAAEKAAKEAETKASSEAGQATSVEKSETEAPPAPAPAKEVKQFETMELF